MIKQLLITSFVTFSTLVTSIPAYALSLVTYPFTSDINSSFQDPIIQSTSFTSSLGNFFVANDGFGSVLQAYPTSGSTDLASAFSNNSYFTINLTAVGGQTFSIGSLNYDVGKGGNSDPRGYSIRSSVDGFTTDIFAQTLPSGPQASPVNNSINLAGSSSFQNLSSVDFRFYVFTPIPSNNSVDFRNLDILSAVPFEFSPTLGLSVLGGAWLVRRTLRRKSAIASKK